MSHILFSIGKGFVGDMMDENNWGKFERGGDQLVIHWEWAISNVLRK